MSRLPARTERREGLTYQPNFLTEDEEREVLHRLNQLEFRNVTMRGQTARRTVAHFGFDYDYGSRKLVPATPFLSELDWLRERCAALADLPTAELAQALITRYPPGAGIGWHRDAPTFGSPVIGVSLGSECRMRFQRAARGTRFTWELQLAPRSIYLLAGEVRWAWQHSIPATDELRYSITFRTVRAQR